MGPAGPIRELASVSFGSITAAAAPGALIADFGSIVFDGGPVTIELAAGWLQLQTNSNASLGLYDFQTGSDVLVSRIAYIREGVTTDAGGHWLPFHFAGRFTPAVGAHRYRLRLQNDGGAAAILTQIDSFPNFARIVKATGIGVAVGTPVYATPAQFATLTPTDGMEVYLQVDATNGVVWHLRYNAASASAYKWEYLGGPPTSHRVDTQQATSSQTYIDLATLGPFVVVPRLGEYRIQFGARLDASVTSWAEVQPLIGGVGDSGSNDAATYFASAANPGVHVSRSVPMKAVTTDTTAGRTIKLAYLTNGSVVNFMRRWLEVTPIRIS
jgi:hypothetical protein